MLLRFLGIPNIKDHYTGDDIDCVVGDIVSVTEKKYAQLMKDFPDEWEEVEEKKDIKNYANKMIASSPITKFPHRCEYEGCSIFTKKGDKYCKKHRSQL